MEHDRERDRPSYEDIINTPRPRISAAERRELLAELAELGLCIESSPRWPEPGNELLTPAELVEDLVDPHVLPPEVCEPQT